MAQHQQQKNIVIVGASSAGANLARALESKLPSTHRIVLIDAQEFAFWPISALRAATVPGWEDKTVKSLSAFFPKSSRHLMLSKTKVVDLDKGYVRVDQPHAELGDEIPFDICVLALGSTYAFPCRPVSERLAEAKQALKDRQSEIALLDNIVIVGGGAVGIEYAGELINQYPNKTITLVQSSDRLLSDKYPTKLSDRLQRELEQRNVRVVLNERVAQDVYEAGKGIVTLKDGSQIKADLIINASGTKPNTTLIRSIDPSALDAKGVITVSPTLRILSTNASSPLTTSPYFAIGDCANSPGGPTAIKAGEDAKGAAANVLATLAGKELKKSGEPMSAIVIPVGTGGGASMLPMVGVMGGWMTSMAKGKGLMVPMFEKLYPQVQAA